MAAVMIEPEVIFERDVLNVEELQLSWMICVECGEGDEMMNMVREIDGEFVCWSCHHREPMYPW